MSDDTDHKGLPYLPLWVADFEDGTVEMTDAELGCYLRLLLSQWRHGHVDGARPPRTCEPAHIETVLAWKFEQLPGGEYQNERLERERQRVAHRAAVARVNGRKGGRPKQSKKTQSKPSGKPKQNPAGNPEQTQRESSPDSISHIPDSKVQGPDSRSQLKAESGSISERDYPQALRYAREIMRVCGRVAPQSMGYRRRVAAAAILAATDFSEAWLADVLAGMKTTAPARSPYAKFLTLCRDRCAAHFETDYDHAASPDQLVIPAAFYAQLDAL